MTCDASRGEQEREAPLPRTGHILAARPESASARQEETAPRCPLGPCLLLVASSDVSAVLIELCF